MSLTESYVKGPAEPVVREITIGQALAEVANEFPEKLGLIAGVADVAARRQWTYAELYTQSLTVARALRTRFEPGERVAVWAPNIPEWILTEYGCALAGVVMVTVNPSFQSSADRGVAVQA
jgi:fatty-acyl-CoA synthase